MSYKNFTEYLDHKNKVAKTKTEKVPDYHGPKDSAPPKEKKHKDAGGKGSVGSAKPYKGGTDAKNPNKSEKGFADSGDKSLKYTPKVEKAGKKDKTWPKTNMQEWIDKSKDMSLASFTKMVREKALGENKQPIQSYNSLKTLVELCQKDKTVISSLIREMKRNELLKSLVVEMLTHPEAIEIIKDTKDNRMLNELFKKPMGPPPMEGDDEGMTTPEDDMGSEEDMEGSEDMDSEEGEDMEDDSEGSDEDMGDSEEGMEDSEMGDEENSLGEPEGGEDMDMPPPKKHLHAHHALSKMHRPEHPMATPMMMKKK